MPGHVSIGGGRTVSEGDDHCLHEGIASRLELGVARLREGRFDPERSRDERHQALDGAQCVYRSAGSEAITVAGMSRSAD